GWPGRFPPAAGEQLRTQPPGDDVVRHVERDRDEVFWRILAVEVHEHLEHREGEAVRGVDDRRASLVPPPSVAASASAVERRPRVLAQAEPPEAHQLNTPCSI